MGLLDSVIGVLSGVRTSSGRGDLLSAVLRMLADDGDGPGMDGLQERFEESGLAETLNSWIGRGANMPIEPEELQRVLGDDTIAALAQQQGLSPATTADRLAQMLPFVVDKLTPGGRLPEGGFGDVGDLMGRMGRR
jgi:uncharacterized protein YidB (DUF937 family)